MQASIYTKNGKIAYQYGNGRALRATDGWSYEVKKNGEWVAARARNITPTVAKVKKALGK
jgi:hypothetical protein